MAKNTKEKIKNKALEMLNNNNYEKISVINVANECGINRNTFYYHYSDISELIKDIVKDEVNRIISVSKPHSSIEEIVDLSSKYFIRNRKALYKVFDSVDRDVFEESLWEICEYTMKVYVANEERYDYKTSNIEDNAIVNYNKCILFGFIMEWIRKDLNEMILNDFLKVLRHNETIHKNEM